MSVFFAIHSKKKDVLMSACATKNCASGSGRKPVLENREDMLTDEIINLHLQKVNFCIVLLKTEHKKLARPATGNRITLFLKPNGFSLWRTTNLTTLTDNKIVQ